MAATDDILRKIQKCLALGQSSEPHEAAAALRQAQKLMERHGVESTDLALAEVGEGFVKSKASVSRIKDWELSLVRTVAEAFGCKLLWRKSHSYSRDVYGQYTLIGLKHQVKIAQYTCEVLQRKLMRARGEFVQTLPEYFHRSRKVIEADGFCAGWVLEIKKTVTAFAHPVSTQELIDNVIKIRTNGPSCHVQQRDKGQLGLQADREAAVGESIYRPINDREPVRRLT
jgi:hypothetical protein